MVFRPRVGLVGIAMEVFTQLFGDLLAFVYHCFDRIVIYGREARINAKSSAARDRDTFPLVSCDPDVSYRAAAIGSIRLGGGSLPA